MTDTVKQRDPSVILNESEVRFAILMSEHQFGGSSVKQLQANIAELKAVGDQPFRLLSGHAARNSDVPVLDPLRFDEAVTQSHMFDGAGDNPRRFKLSTVGKESLERVAAYSEKLTDDVLDGWARDRLAGKVKAVLADAPVADSLRATIGPRNDQPQNLVAKAG